MWGNQLLPVLCGCMAPQRAHPELNDDGLPGEEGTMPLLEMNKHVNLQTPGHTMPHIKDPKMQVSLRTYL